ncbi:hypothetical protein [Rhodopirellula europaea]|jgi:hypothetical protein|uniref:Uncharacterized protein n=1 Tax=Rhodopirellula europaea 6C TaxID=1263867 RepID=M2ATA2_9BACT|nr:hypothetical protein [Rhodopirellula europaea]EMB15932.1 hypothetical protein RE6C_03337 [Rhodopirellula europaea 6C]
MTTYHRYVLDDAATISLPELETALRSIDDAYRFDGEALVRGDHDCALQIDVTERESDIFDDDIDLLIGFASKRRDRDRLVARLNGGTCMVTMQVVSYSDESAIEHVFDTLSRLHSGLAVYEGGIFDTPEPTRPWIQTALNVVRGIGGNRGEP